jgi:hypothetical protein
MLAEKILQLYREQDGEFPSRLIALIETHAL